MGVRPVQPGYATRRLAIPALAVLLLATLPWLHPAAAAASAERALARAGMLRHALEVRAARAVLPWRLPGHVRVDAGCAVVWAPAARAAEARAVARAVPRLLERVAEALGLGPGDVAVACAARGPVQVVLVDDPAALARLFRLPPARPAEGAYHRGVIGVLGPAAWGGGPGGVRAFLTRGALAHELAHFLVDARSGGRAPAWWSEGLAQLADWRVTGYVWEAPARRGPYSLAELERAFDRLDAPTAYRQALALARAVERRGGPHAWGEALRRLAAGEPPRAALAAAAGVAEAELPRWARAVPLEPPAPPAGPAAAGGGGGGAGAN